MSATNGLSVDNFFLLRLCRPMFLVSFVAKISFFSLRSLRLCARRSFYFLIFSWWMGKKKVLPFGRTFLCKQFILFLFFATNNRMYTKIMYRMCSFHPRLSKCRMSMNSITNFINSELVANCNRSFCNQISSMSTNSNCTK